MIYFALDPRHNEVKIGYTTNLDRRMESFKTARPGLKVIQVIDGDLSKEHEIHASLSKYRIHGEWFEFNEHVESVMLSYGFDIMSKYKNASAMICKYLSEEPSIYKALDFYHNKIRIDNFIDCKLSLWEISTDIAFAIFMENVVFYTGIDHYVDYKDHNIENYGWYNHNSQHDKNIMDSFIYAFMNAYKVRSIDLIKFIDDDIIKNNDFTYVHGYKELLLLREIIDSDIKIKIEPMNKFICEPYKEILCLMK